MVDMPTVEAARAKTGPWMKALTKLAGVDEETLNRCPRHDHENVRAVGEIMLFTWLYQTVLFSLVSHQLFAAPAQIRPDLILASMFVAGFILAIDSYMVLRSGWHLGGISELKRGGLDISGGPAARIKARFFLAIRIALSVGLAQLTAVFASLLIFGSDIDSRIQNTYLQANSHLIADATGLVDGAIQRSTRAVTEQSTRVAALTSQVTALQQNEIDPSANRPEIQQAQQELSQLLDQRAKAEEEVRRGESFAVYEKGGIKGSADNTGQPGAGPRYRAAVEELANAKAHLQEIDRELSAVRARLDGLRQQISSGNDAVMQRSQSQLPAFEEALKAETTKLTSLKNDLAQLTANRESAIRNAVENAPDHVGFDNGFLARIAVLERIAREDTKIAAVILLIDVISFGFELAAVLAKVTSFVPTTYATLLAGDAYMRVVRMANAIMVELKAMDGREEEEPGIVPRDEPLDRDKSEGLIPQEEPLGSPNGAGAQPPKRGRGRPRKYPLPRIVTDASGPEDSEPEAEQPLPE